MTRLRFVLMCAVLLVAVAGCGKGEGESQSSAQNHGQRQPGSGQRPGGAAGAAKAIPVAVQPAALGSIASYYKATATLEAEKQAEVLARVTGVVTSLTAEEGDFVAAGAPLLTIGNDEYRLRLQQAAARTANLQSRFDRLQAMKAEELSTEEEFEAARSDLASAEADEGLARLNLSYTTVRAPFAGRITARLVDLGQTVSANTALFVMADFDPLLARVHVPSREFRKLRQDQLVDLVLDSSGARMQAAYPDDTRPGDFAEVQIVTERRDDVVLVQRSAVITDKGETVVYVAVTDGDTDQAERRLVTVGFSDDSNTQIVSGLAVGESVVVKGQRSLKHGAAMKILAETTDVAADGVAD